MSDHSRSPVSDCPRAGITGVRRAERLKLIICDPRHSLVTKKSAHDMPAQNDVMPDTPTTYGLAIIGSCCT